MLGAWVDESIHVDTGRYLLAAYVAPSAEASIIADSLRRLRRGRSTRLHWHREADGVRRQFLIGAGGLGGFTVAVVGTGLVPSKQERARRQCLESLLISLEALGVTSVVLERRTPSLNRRDINFVKTLRGKKWLTSRIAVEFGDPNTDPMLWVSDAMCAVIAASEAGNNHWLDLVEQRPQIIRISLRM